MNFLLRPSAHNVVKEQVSGHESLADTRYVSKPAATLEGLISEDPFPESPVAEDRDGETDVVGVENDAVPGPNGKNDSLTLENHSDVSEEEGWITIPYSTS